MVDPEKKYSISEVARITRYESHVLRYYEKEFDLKIPRNESNHRYYTYKEIETFRYIKSLQDKGFTNKQIKLIMNTPEILVNEQKEETAVTSLVSNELAKSSKTDDISIYLKNFIISEIQPKLFEREDKHLELMNELKEEISDIRYEIRNKEQDVLICENAKLKMKVKEKSYEVAELKEKLKREKNANKSIFKRIFHKK